MTPKPSKINFVSRKHCLTHSLVKLNGQIMYGVKMNIVASEGTEANFIWFRIFIAGLGNWALPSNDDVDNVACLKHSKDRLDVFVGIGN